ncbi:hypothetical protein ACFC0S_33970 [Streptomyces sp. NPDC056084]|uniref:hypothetical protein n=1 Tax=unclassified Streptomyces TaxID=2593676 RepID=UPI0035D6FD4C
MLLKTKSIDDGFAGTDLRKLSLPLSGWSLRIGQSGQERLALAVYDNEGNCVDAMASSLLSPTLLRDVWHGERRGQHWTLAWGKVPNDVEDVHVAFRQPRRVLPVPPVIIANRFWVAETADRYRHVAAFAGGSPWLMRARGI